VWLTAGVACGCDGSGGTAASGVSAHKKITSLGDGEIKQLCEWSNELSDTGLSDEQICTYDALLANTSDECKAQRDACVKRSKAGMSPGLLGVRTQDCSGKSEAAIPVDCNATVQALERCHSDLIDAMVADAMRASCDSLGVIWTGVPESCPKDVLACTRLITAGSD
jgi:hypothetical protein